MATKRSELAERGQVTLPADIRDKPIGTESPILEWQGDDDAERIDRQLGIVDRLFGVFRSAAERNAGKSMEQILAEEEEAIAERIAADWQAKEARMR